MSTRSSNKKSGKKSIEIPKTFRQLSLDLSNEDAVPALEALLKLPVSFSPVNHWSLLGYNIVLLTCLSPLFLSLSSLSQKQRERVRSAHIFTQNGYIRISNSEQQLAQAATPKVPLSLPVMISQIFDMLSRLPNLKSVTVDMHHNVPLQALALLLQCPKLKTLQLAHVSLTDILSAPSSIGNGSMTELDVDYILNSDDDDDDDDDDEEADELLMLTTTPTTHQNLVSDIFTQSSSLQELSLLRCRSVGGAIVRLLRGLSSSTKLSKLTVSSTPIGSTYPAAEATLRSIVHNASLASLTLSDVPGLLDEHMSVFAEASPALRTLEITSSVFGEGAGKVLVGQLLQHNLIAIETLKLHIDWEKSGLAVAKMLRSNMRLKQLDLR